MVMTDTIADMLTRIRNANQRRLATLDMPLSKMKVQIAEILKNEGFIIDYALSGKGIDQILKIELKYKGKTRVITGIKRISKPGLRVYTKTDNLPKVLNGFGIAIISTSKGIMTDQKARTQNLGGEVLAYVW